MRPPRPGRVRTIVYQINRQRSFIGAIISRFAGNRQPNSVSSRDTHVKGKVNSPRQKHIGAIISPDGR
jgi:hypothetical protein